MVLVDHDPLIFAAVSGLQGVICGQNTLGQRNQVGKINSLPGLFGHLIGPKNGSKGHSRIISLRVFLRSSPSFESIDKIIRSIEPVFEIANMPYDLFDGFFGMM